MYHPFETILFPTDFSECSDNAKWYALGLVKASQGAFHAVHALSDSHVAFAGVYSPGAYVEASEDAIEDYANEQMDALVQWARRQGVEAHGHKPHGSVASSVAALAEELNADLIVEGTRGRTGLGHALAGSTAEEIIRGAPVPVLSVKEHDQGFAQGGRPLCLDRLLLPMDFSAVCQEALPLAVQLCDEFGATLRLVYVLEPRGHMRHLSAEETLSLPMFEDDAMERLEAVAAEYPNTDFEIDLTHGKASRAIVDTADLYESELIVMATHGYGGLTHALMGSVTEEVVQRAPCPVLTLRPSVNVRQSV